MACNESRVDRILRVVLGSVLVAGGFYFKSWWGIVGLVPLLTAAIGWCPLYSLLGVHTCKVPQKS